MTWKLSEVVRRGLVGDDMDGVNLDRMPAKYWTVETKMSYLQRLIIVYSIMYYDQSESCVSDKYYDTISHQLVGMMAKYPLEYKRTQYYYAMHDFDGNTGFDIPYRLNEKDRTQLNKIAEHVHNRWRQETGGKVLK